MDAEWMRTCLMQALERVEGDVTAELAEVPQRIVAEQLGISQPTLSRRFARVLDGESSWLRDELDARQLATALLTLPPLLGRLIAAATQMRERQAGGWTTTASPTEQLKKLCGAMSEAQGLILRVIEADSEDGTAVSRREQEQLRPVFYRLIEQVAAVLGAFDAGGAVR